MTHPSEELLARHMNHVHAVARSTWRRLGRRVDLADLIAAGNTALLKAAERHDEGRCSFRSHLNKRLHWAMQDVARKRLGQHQRDSRRVPTFAARRFGDGNRNVRPLGHAHSVLDLGANSATSNASSQRCDELAVSEQASPEAETIRHDLARHIRASLEELSEPERRVVERHYFDGERFSEVARELKMSRFAVCRLHKKAVRSLGRSLRQRCDAPAAREAAAREGAPPAQKEATR